MTVALPSRTRTETPCTADPDRWIEAGNDPALIAACRRCPRRLACARESQTIPQLQGVVAGVYIPPLKDDAGQRYPRARRRALDTLKVIATYAPKER